MPTSEAHHIRTALHAKGYMVLGRRTLESQPEEHITLTYYTKDRITLVLEVIKEAQSRTEIACELLLAVTDRADVARTIAAIP